MPKREFRVPVPMLQLHPSGLVRGSRLVVQLENGVQTAEIRVGSHHVENLRAALGGVRSPDLQFPILFDSNRRFSSEGSVTYRGHTFLGAP